MPIQNARKKGDTVSYKPNAHRTENLVVLSVDGGVDLKTPGGRTNPTSVASGTDIGEYVFRFGSPGTV